jgi:hypothetical protein
VLGGLEPVVKKGRGCTGPLVGFVYLSFLFVSFWMCYLGYFLFSQLSRRGGLVEDRVIILIRSKF